MRTARSPGTTASWIKPAVSAPSSARAAFSVAGAGCVQTTTFCPLAARDRLALARTTPDGLTLCTTTDAGTASVIVRFTFVTVRFAGHACDVATLTASSSSEAETTAPVNATTNGAPAFDAKSSLYADCRDGYGSTALPPFGWTSKCRCG